MKRLLNLFRFDLRRSAARAAQTRAALRRDLLRAQAAHRPTRRLRANLRAVTEDLLRVELQR